MIKELFKQLHATESMTERARIYTQIREAVIDLSCDEYINEYETSLFYDEDYVNSLQDRRDGFVKGFFKAVEMLVI